MQRLRKILFWSHLVVGVAVALSVALLAVTGLVMAFEHPIVAWAERADGRPPSADATRLPVETLLERAAAVESNATPSGITVRSDPNEPVAVHLGKENVIQLNGYTGEKVGNGAPALREFFHFVLHLHRSLALEGLGREVGRTTTRVATIGLALLVVSGLWLWVPRKWKWSSFRPVLLFNWRLKGKPRNWNWHNVVGFWSAVPLLAIAVTGVIIGYSWANDLLYLIVGEQPPPSREHRQGGGRSGEHGGKREQSGGDKPGHPVADKPEAGDRKPNGDEPNGGWDGRIGDDTPGENKPNSGWDGRIGDDRGRRRHGGERQEHGPGDPNRPKEPLKTTGLNDIWTKAADSHPGWTSIVMSLGGKAVGDGHDMEIEKEGMAERHDAVTVVVNTGDPYSPFNRVTLRFNRNTREVIDTQRFDDLTPAQKLKVSWCRLTGARFSAPPAASSPPSRARPCCSSSTPGSPSRGTASSAPGGRQPQLHNLRTRKPRAQRPRRWRSVRLPKRPSRRSELRARPVEALKGVGAFVPPRQREP